MTFSKRVRDLVAEMTTPEKAGQLNLFTSGGDTKTGAVTNENVAEKLRMGKIGAIFHVASAESVRTLQDMARESRMGIPLLLGADIIHGHRTIFPIPLALSCSWNKALFESTARVAAYEASSDGIDLTFAPMIDISRDPRWGRIAESPGEDPFLTACYARSQVRGFQGKNLADPTSIMACPKHFVAYGAADGGADYNRAQMGPAELHNVYIPPFIAALKAGAGSIMAGFHTLDGIPMHAHPTLIGTVLRGIHGFNKLMTVADYTGIVELVQHGVAENGAEAARLSLKAGVDLDMVSELYMTTLESSIRNGLIKEKYLDDACGRILHVKETLGLLDDPYRRTRSAPVSLTPDHLALARTAAAESCVLLKNDSGVLPLSKSAKVALIGPLSNDKVNMNGTWAVNASTDNCVTLLEGMRSVAGKDAIITYEKGANIVDDPIMAHKLNVHNPVNLSVTIDKRTPEKMIEDAILIGEDADIYVVGLGEGKEGSGESSSVASPHIPEEQKRLLRALKETGKPIVVVVMSGRPLVLKEEAELADSLLLGWFGGTQAGNGIADILYGDVNPSGRLSATFPVHQGQIPVYYAHESTGRPYTGKHQKFTTGYLDLEDGPTHKSGLFPFGYGRSYTEFEHSAPVATFNHNRTEIIVTTTVTNTGDRVGKEVVQFYAADTVAQRSRPVKELKGFEKTKELNPGESDEVIFRIKRKDLSFSIAESVADTRRLWEAGEFVLSTGRNSQDLKSVSVFWEGPARKKSIEYAL